jgi:hypothetical protein
MLMTFTYDEECYIFITNLLLNMLLKIHLAYEYTGS